ncbi:hypothetical protein [Paraburkholderia sp. BCC1876]|uniref:hypothetical protein n=1 Tax=Paraburkholderia sp. BCC1876 TaxID=2676303 RepID=UPI001FC832FE|nr:hypothetical protein [Paraburkholderia sp. BCC1876]
MRVRIFTRMLSCRDRTMGERRAVSQSPVAVHGAQAIRSTHAAQAAHAAQATHTIRSCRKAAVLATIVAAASLALATSRYVAAHVDTSHEQREIQTSQDCSARYAALLDLAELARRDGKSSEVVVRGLSDRAGAMSACLPTVHAAQPGRRADATKKSAPDS